MKKLIAAFLAAFSIYVFACYPGGNPQGAELLENFYLSSPEGIDGIVPGAENSRIKNGGEYFNDTIFDMELTAQLPISLYVGFMEDSMSFISSENIIATNTQTGLVSSFSIKYKVHHQAETTYRLRNIKKLSNAMSYDPNYLKTLIFRRDKTCYNLAAPNSTVWIAEGQYTFKSQGRLYSLL